MRERLARLGLETVLELLLHLPLRYEDRSTVRPIGGLRTGDFALIEGVIEAADVVRGSKARLVCRISDGTGHLTLSFFNFYANQVKQLQRGERVRCFGEVRAVGPSLQMTHPEYHLEHDEAGWNEGGYTPVYPLTQGLTQAAMRRMVAEALRLAAQPGALAELLPYALREELRLPSLYDALALIHHPPADAPIEALMAREHPAMLRVLFEELLAHQISLRQLREQVRAESRAPVLRPAGQLVKRFLENLPFELTGAQQRVDTEVAADMASDAPMLRLVQGDVGSGKTVIAALAALRAVECGWQAAVMAPTELLAEQHHRNFANWLEPLGLDVAWLSGRVGGQTRRDMLAGIADGGIRVAVGTHALFQESVEFQQLGLVVVDEQHRFGVHQRLALQEKGGQHGRRPHQLIMTATPIPRTLAMTAYADLDVSVIDELPPGRTPVTTVAIPDARRDEVIERVRAACAAGRQAYWVCTLIEESEKLEAEAAEATAERLSESLPELRVGLVHGRMRGADKEAVMGAFAAGELDLLVATTVIEVGVDVPNASLMIIENPERLGLSQLHQLRGRVGRGRAASSCVLMYHGPLSDTARHRLGVLRETTDGFEVARRDLELRGPGELLGTRQTGALNYRVADLARDAKLLPRVQHVAVEMLKQHPQYADALVQRWIGERQRYARV